MSPSMPPTLSRRRLFAGAASAGALAAAAATVPLGRDEEAPPASAKPSGTDGRYQLTQHVLRYYETTKV